MLNVLAKLVPSIVGFLGKLGLSNILNLGFLGPVGPILTAVGQFVGSIISAVAEIIGAMARSYEGRWALAGIALALAGLYGRWHYIEQGRAEAPVKIVTRTIRTPAPPPIVKYVQKACPALPAKRG
jgi:hypothetical protein